MFPPDSCRGARPDVLVTIFDEPLTAESLRLASELRAAGLRVELYPGALRNGKDLGKAFKYADARHARFVTVLGQDELARGEVKIKDLRQRPAAIAVQRELGGAAAHCRRAARSSSLEPRTRNDRRTARTTRAHPHLRRTHRRRRRPGRRAARLGASRARSRRRHVLRHPRPPRPDAGRRPRRALEDKAKRLRPEFVVGVIGRVDARAKDAINPKLKTGEIEVAAHEIRLLNDAKTPPFPINEDTPVSEEMRLRYRYLDLRRPRLQQNMILRHKAAFAVRQYFDENGFLEIETPILTKSTPEGARDYLVPSRVHPGEFFALPQSPQIFKQILMISGMDRYFQIAKCFRDEDLRADRQPEFTQVDLEISFATENLVFSILEPLMGRLMALIGRDAPTPFPPDAVCRGDCEVRIRQARPAPRHGAEGAVGAVCVVELLGLPQRDRGRRRSARLRRAERRALLAQGSRQPDRRGEAARRRRAGLGARRPKAACRARRSKAAGEDAIRAALELAGAGAGRSAADGRRRARRRRRGCWGSCA